MKYVHVLLSVIALSFLSACGEWFTRTVTVSDCSWADRISFEDETIDWLGGLPHWPDTAYEDFGEVGDHNELHDKYCGTPVN